MGVTMADGQRVVQLERRAGPKTEGRTVVVASERLAAAQQGPIYLRIDARGAEYDFSFAYADGQWIPLKKGADGTILSTMVAGGFVGAMFGMYAYAERP